MVDIVIVTDAVLKMDIVVYGSNNILFGNVLRNQIMYIILNSIRKLFGFLGEFVDNLDQFREVYKLGNAEFLGFAVDPLGNVSSV